MKIVLSIVSFLLVASAGAKEAPKAVAKPPAKSAETKPSASPAPAPAPAPEKAKANAIDEYADPKTVTTPTTSAHSVNEPPEVTQQRNGPCRKDVDTYCNNVKAGGGRIANCLRENIRKISAECKDTIKNRTANQRDFRESCNDDINTLCKTIAPGQNATFRCLRLNISNLSTTCRNEVEETMKRRRQAQRNRNGAAPDGPGDHLGD